MNKGAYCVEMRVVEWMCMLLSLLIMIKEMDCGSGDRKPVSSGSYRVLLLSTSRETVGDRKCV